MLTQRSFLNVLSDTSMRRMSRWSGPEWKGTSVYDSNASGLLRNRLDGAASETETLLAHNLADIVGTIAMFLAMLVLMFLFDWRMGAACLLAAVVSVLAMGTMMGGKNARLMAEYQAAQDVMSTSGPTAWDISMAPIFPRR